MNKQRLFISYQKADEDFASLVKAKAEQSGKYQAWLATEVLEGGQNWRNAIDDGITESDAFIVIMSPEARQSEYVTYEWAYALGKSVPVVTILYRKTDLHPRLELLQYVDFTHAKQWGRLFDSIDSRISQSVRRNRMHIDNGVIESITKQFVQTLALQVNTASDGGSRIGKRDVLVVVDAQRDFFNGGSLAALNTETLIAPLNKAIGSAIERGMEVIFTRDWHPHDHVTFKDFGVHCVRNTEGAEFHPDLWIPKGRHVVDIGVKTDDENYSGCTTTMLDILRGIDVGKIYVTGIALEYCVLATCGDLAQKHYSVTACDSLIRSATTDPSVLRRVWDTLGGTGVQRTERRIPWDT